MASAPSSAAPLFTAGMPDHSASHDSGIEFGLCLDLLHHAGTEQLHVVSRSCS